MQHDVQRAPSRDHCSSPVSDSLAQRAVVLRSRHVRTQRLVPDGSIYPVHGSPFLSVLSTKRVPFIRLAMLTV